MNIMHFEYEPERLIEEVKKRPGIWDFDHLHYRTKKIRTQLWCEVVEALLDENAEIDKSERRELELQIQKKWKCIRDNFMRYVQNPNRTSRPYIYSSKLTFLLKDQDLPTPSTKTEACSQSEEDIDRSNVKYTVKRLKRKKRKAIKKNDSDDEIFGSEDIVSNSNDGYNHNNKSPSPSTVGRFAFACVDTSSKEKEDSDKLFLLSLLPHLKAVPDENKLNAKMKLMQVLSNARHANFP